MPSFICRNALGVVNPGAEAVAEDEEPEEVGREGDASTDACVGNEVGRAGRVVEEAEEAREEWCLTEEGGEGKRGNVEGLVLEAAVEEDEVGGAAPRRASISSSFLR